MGRANGFASTTAALARAIADRLQGKGVPSPLAPARELAGARGQQAMAASPPAAGKHATRAARSGNNPKRCDGQHRGPAVTESGAEAADPQEQLPPDPAEPVPVLVGTEPERKHERKQTQPCVQRSQKDQASKRLRVGTSDQPPAQRRCREQERAPAATGNGPGAVEQPDQRQKAPSRRRCGGLWVTADSDPTSWPMLHRQLANKSPNMYFSRRFAQHSSTAWFRAV